MPKDIALSNPDHDTILSFNDLELIDNAEEVAQSVKIRLLWILGEWFDNSALGIPWLTVMTNSEVPMLVKRDKVRRVILDTQGIRSVNEIAIEHDNNDGIALLTFKATTDEGIILTEEVRI